jgi:hypothetical protein
MEEAMDKASHLSFLLKPISFEARALIESLIECSKPDMKRRKKLSDEFINAMELTIPMLIKAAGEEEGGFLYRSMATGSFKAGAFGNDTASGKAVGHRPFTNVINGLRREGFLEVITGYIECAMLGFGKGIATRFRATEKLINLAKDHNIIPELWSAHFAAAPRPMRIADPIILKGTSWKDQKGKKHKGEILPVDYGLPHVAAHGEEVNDLTTYMARQDIQPAHLHHRFVRVFGDGDKGGADFSKGGRLYSHGIGKGYQNVRKHIRRAMTISGEAIAEVDLRASYLTILHKHLGVPLPNTDPYDMPGVPRGIVKMWASITLGNGGFHNRWPDESKSRYADDEETKGCDLQADYPFRKTQRKILEHLPLMEEWAKNPIGWGDLQFIESTAVIAAVKRLAFEHDIPALPLHDALMVPESKADIAAQCLFESFFVHVGIAPHITISTHKKVADQTVQ